MIRSFTFAAALAMAAPAFAPARDHGARRQNRRAIAARRMFAYFSDL